MLSGIPWYDDVLQAQWSVEHWAQDRLRRFEIERDELRTALGHQPWTRKPELQERYWKMWQRIEERYVAQCNEVRWDADILQSFARHTIFAESETWHGKSDSK